MSIIKITNRSLDNITWQSEAGCEYLIKDGNIDIWRINISSNLPNLNYFISLLNPTELERSNKYYQLKDKNRFIVSRGALRYILGRYLRQHPALIDFGLSDNKKPFIKNNPHLQFNLSHSSDWILIAIADATIGADIEFINDNFKYADVLGGNFSTDEINQIVESKSAERFFVFWTRKEAITKATGKGLDENLKMIPAADGTYFANSNLISSISNLFVTSFTPDIKYAASVCSNSSANDIRFWDIQF
ncbi:4'-phosphopantetheinyl transferase family protein [Mucilaginibacter sp. X4EP1]|uniref:4'-phosphopantetheinyl transferase family protein n=1 Tax=Mucilaginibacter sp. X4EP1 TaxID=2723092 RepID=UPI002169D1D7|nr:4'-phosphopantetheinyl transferase superfamily protein [Mucilaginibacter sp. X4EP1]MCS3815804.1 4'-phosphopantetheinyl transferase [Mucilaginibacter sp. X4EP1]